jgi:hypothetical protein
VRLLTRCLSARDFHTTLSTSVTIKVSIRFSILVCVCAQFAGCADFARSVRQYTYPPDFRYIEREQLRSAMWRLAYHVRELDRAVDGGKAPSEKRGEILKQLDGMDAALQILDTSGWPSNHPKIDMNLPKFRQDIRLARAAAERNPPNFVQAHSLTGACVYCHGAR